jgi:hypothetical protein
VPPLFAASLLGLAAASPFSSFARRGLAALAGTYAAANLAASVRSARGEDRRSLALQPPVFATLHLAYGTGFLCGLARFRRRWKLDGSERARGVLEPGRS